MIFVYIFVIILGGGFLPPLFFEKRVHMFNLTHILYMVISAGLSVLILFLLRRYVKDEEGHIKAIKFFALITVIIHYSSLWVEFFASENAVAEIGGNMLLAKYPCNLIMWLLLIVAFMKKRDSLLYRALSEFVFLGGTVCAVIGIVFNENFDSTPTLLDYEVLKGLLSHSTMLLGCLHLQVSGIIKLRVKSTFSVIFGMLIFLFNGLIVNGLYSIFGLPECNSMYLQEPPFESMPWLNTATIGIAAVLVGFIACLVSEAITLPKEERWINKTVKLIKEKSKKNV